MLDVMDIHDAMEVVDARGAHVGTVDRVTDGRIKLTREDSASDTHRFIEVSATDHIDGDRIFLRHGAPRAMSEAEIAAASEHHAVVATPLGGAAVRPIFGTSGEGTGMGGSGRGQH
ncbi:MAG: DUF2171 domain-containing protein [Sphingobium sp.]